MIQIALPGYRATQIYYGNAPPSFMRQYMVPHVKCGHLSWPAGNMLMQWKTGRNVDLCVHHFELEESAFFDLRCTEDVFVFFVMLAGEATLYFPDETDDMCLLTGRLHLFLVPQHSECRMEMGAGCHKSCHVFLKPEDVHLMGSDLAPVADLVAIWQQGATHMRPGQVCTPTTPMMLQLLQELERCDEPEAACYNRVYRGVLQLFDEYRRELIKALHTMNALQSDREVIRSIHTHILDHYTDDEAVRVAALASIAGMSLSRLERLFGQGYGMTVYEFVTQCRIRLACDLLTNTDKTVREIGYMVGYNSPVSFHRVFVRVCGCTPVAYRGG